MSRVKTPKRNTTKRGGVPKYRRKQRSASIYFLLCTVFAMLSLVAVLVFSIPQQYLFSQTYQKEASNSVLTKGHVISHDVGRGLPEELEGDWDEYVRRLSYAHQVKVYVLSENGEVLYPEKINFEDEENGETNAQNEAALAKNVIATHLEKINAEQKRYVVYKHANEYVYGSSVLVNGQNAYLYVGQSLELMTVALRGMTTRIVLLAIFVFMLSFFIGSAVAGWLVKPMAEMTEKARALAQGNFDMDFHGTDYGKEMVELADALNHARDELSKTDRMQKELLANVSHDFKTPLTMIKAYASMIVEISGDNPKKRNEHAQVIIDETDRLTSLVSDVLDLSKISSGMQPLTLQPTDISVCVREALRRFEYLKETQGYQFITDIDEGLFAMVDELRLEQVIYNLIGNAVNYTGDDKQITVRLKREKEKDGFYFSVTDTGAGIPPEEIDEIWDRYYRSNSSHKRPVKGTGLGLSIVKTILEKHGLEFGVRSEVGKGSTFYVCFSELS